MSDTKKTEGSMQSAPDANAPKQTYSASCHCGAFKYTVTASPPLDQGEVMECNCSICSRNGYMFIYPPNENISFTKGDFTEFRSYTFGPKPKVAHYFCGTCGASCMARSIDPNFFAGVTCINVRMFEDVDLKSLKIKFADGKSYKQEE